MFPDIILTPFISPPMLLSFWAISLFLLSAATYYYRSHDFRLWLKYSLFIHLIVLFCLNPGYSRTQQTRLPDITLVLVDDSYSTFPETPDHPIQQRQNDILLQLQNLHPQHAEKQNTPLSSPAKLQIHYLSEFTKRSSGTPLWAAYRKVLQQVNVHQVRSFFILSDAKIDDLPDNIISQMQTVWGTKPPPHHLIITQKYHPVPYLKWQDPPTYHLRGQKAVFKLIYHCPKQAECPQTLPLTFSINKAPSQTKTVSPGQTVQFDHIFERPGQYLVTLHAKHTWPSLKNTLTLSHEISILQDRLRALMISGPPHMSSRIWRSLLRADPNIDLVHFSVLRPQHKVDATPARDLALIPFPMQDLFEQHLNQFDFIIWDRYHDSITIPPHYLAHLRSYLHQGGGMLYIPYIPPEKRLADTRPPLVPLLQQALPDILPAITSSPPHYQKFRPTYSSIGETHPVTQNLHSSYPRGWDAWYRHLMSKPTPNALTLLKTDTAPLLILKSAKKGRIAQLNSDQIWIWARQIDQGGPALSLLRNLILWMLKDPKMDTRQFHFIRQEHSLLLTYQDITPTITTVFLIDPMGKKSSLRLKSGQKHAVPLKHHGLYQAYTEENTPLFTWHHHQLAPETEFSQAPPPLSDWLPLLKKSHGKQHFWQQGDTLHMHSFQRRAKTPQDISFTYMSRHLTQAHHPVRLPLIPDWAWFFLFLFNLWFLWSLKSPFTLLKKTAYRNTVNKSF